MRRSATVLKISFESASSDTARASDIAPTSALKVKIALDLAARLSFANSRNANRKHSNISSSALAESWASGLIGHSGRERQIVGGGTLAKRGPSFQCQRPATKLRTPPSTLDFKIRKSEGAASNTSKADHLWMKTQNPRIPTNSAKTPITIHSTTTAVSSTYERHSTCISSCAS